ncbi:hypothetical protein R6Q59_031455 [Mikania micrantha]
MIKPPTPVPAPAADMKFRSMSSVSPSFTTNSSSNLADIAARVVEEFRNENGHGDDDDIYNFIDDANQVHVPVVDELEANCEEESDEEEEFAFDVVCTNYNSSSVSADEIFFNGELLPRYPLFDRSLLLENVADKSDGDSPNRRSPAVRHSLRHLFIEERETASCSSSEADDLDGVTPGTYCIWKPKVESSESCKKSNSTGNSSKRWKFLHLLRRSNSDVDTTAGRNDLDTVFRPSTETKKVKKVEKTAKVAVADDDGEPAPLTSEIKSPNKTIKEGNCVGSYLPIKQDLVGVFANVNGLSRNLHPF